MDELPLNDNDAKVMLRSIAALPPENVHRDTTSWDFLMRLDAARLESQVRPLMHELLLDADATVRYRALGVLMTLPTSKQSLDLIVKAAQNHAPLFRAVSADGSRLDEALQHALANEAISSGRGKEITRVFKQIVGSELPSEPGVVGHYDVDWSLDLARRFAGKHVEGRYWSRLTESVGWYHRDRLIDLLSALNVLPAEAKEMVIGAVAGDLGQNEARMIEMCKEDGIAPPIRPVPTLAECRKAIGL
jgi:hypothetical protein